MRFVEPRNPQFMVLSSIVSHTRRATLHPAHPMLQVRVTHLLVIIHEQPSLVERENMR
jgi:hypothetical protein